MRIVISARRCLCGPFLVVFLIILILISCQNDQGMEMDFQNVKSFERIKISNEPVARNLLKCVFSMKSFSKGCDSLDLPEEVLKTISEYGKTTYSFGVDLPEGSEYFRNLVITKSPMGWVGYYIDFYPDPKWIYANPIGLPQMVKFTGTTIKYDLYFNVIYTSYFNEGVIYKYVLNASGKGQDYCLQVTDAYFEAVGLGPVSNCDGGKYHSESTGWDYPCDLVLIGYERPCTDGGSIFSSPIWGDGSFDTGTEIIDAGNTTNTTTTSNEDTNIPHGGGGGTGSTIIGINNYVLPKIDAKSILSNPKMACIYRKLIETNLIGRYIKKFDGDFPVSHLRYELIDSLPNNVLGNTKPMSKDFWIVIQINENLIKEYPPLELAATLIHETIHAEMFRLMVSVGYVALSSDNFPGLFDYYERYLRSSNQGTPQHNLMADFYIEIMANALREFDKDRNPYRLYQDLAWEGLRKTSAWDKLGETEQDRIIQSILDYRKKGTKECDVTQN